MTLVHNKKGLFVESFFVCVVGFQSSIFRAPFVLKNCTFRFADYNKMVSGSGFQCFFIPYNWASTIVDKIELGALNKAERALTGEMIKNFCIPISIDRLGNLIIPQQP